MTIRIMDRYLLRSFLVAYAICFMSLVGLYVIIDLFTNADEFIEDRSGTFEFVRRVVKFYFIHSFEYFNRLSPVITMISAMTTLATLHRNNEIVALLAAGIPTRRALVPILAGTLLVIGFGISNREMILPYYSLALQRMHEDIDADRVLLPSMNIDSDQVLFRADSAFREDRRLEGVNITLPVEVAGVLQEIHAARAYNTTDDTGAMGWRLDQPDASIEVANTRGKIVRLADGSLFIRSNVTFEEMIRRPNWKAFAATSDLVKLLQREEIKDPQNVRAMIHNRIMDPAIHFMLVLLGIPFVLQWERKNVFAGIAIAMGLCGAFFVVVSVMGYLASNGYCEPMLSAWAPLFLFSPLAVSLFHRIGT